MSAQWRGLRNPDTHGTTSDGEPYCESCGVCDEGWRCRCCLAAEVEALRAQVQADEEAERSLRERYNDLLVDHGKLTAQVQRVREACEPFGPMGSIAVWRILRALDGDA